MPASPLCTAGLTLITCEYSMLQQDISFLLNTQREREGEVSKKKNCQSINTNHWCGKLILDCFSGFVQNCFVEGKKEIKALIILGN